MRFAAPALAGGFILARKADHAAKHAAPCYGDAVFHGPPHRQ